MESDQLRGWLKQQVHSSGVAAEMKAKLKTVLMSRLLQQRNPNDPTASPAFGRPLNLCEKALNWLISNHLQAIGFECTHNVFLAEMGKETTISDAEAREVLRIKNSQVMTLEEGWRCILQQGRIGIQVEHAHVQATPNAAHMTLEEKLCVHDRDLELHLLQAMKNGPDPSWENRLKQRSAEIEALVRQEAKTEMDAWKKKELEQMRCDEAAKYRRLTESKSREYAELEQQLRHALNLEQYELNRAKRELEAKATEIECERNRLNVMFADRERTANTMHAELLETRDKIRNFTTELTLSQEQVRDLSMSIEILQRRLKEKEQECLKLQNEQASMELRHQGALEAAQKMINTQREELTQRSLDVEHRLQGEQLRFQREASALRDHYEQEENRLQDRMTTISKREEVLKKAVADAQKAILAQQQVFGGPISASHQQQQGNSPGSASLSPASSIQRQRPPIGSHYTNPHATLIIPASPPHPPPPAQHHTATEILPHPHFHHFVNENLRPVPKHLDPVVVPHQTTATAISPADQIVVDSPVYPTTPSRQISPYAVVPPQQTIQVPTTNKPSLESILQPLIIDESSRRREYVKEYIQERFDVSVSQLDAAENHGRCYVVSRYENVTEMMLKSFAAINTLVSDEIYHRSFISENYAAQVQDMKTEERKAFTAIEEKAKAATPAPVPAPSSTQDDPSDLFAQLMKIQQEAKRLAQQPAATSVTSVSAPVPSVTPPVTSASTSVVRPTINTAPPPPAPALYEEERFESMSSGDEVGDAFYKKKDEGNDDW